MPKQALYTCLMGGYENLNELEITGSGGVECICFTDDTSLVSSTWKIVYVPKIFEKDPIRNQRIIKILGHPALLPFEETLYIDNAVKLLVPPGRLLDEWLACHDMAIPLHSFRSFVRDEFKAVLDIGLDSQERVDEQFSHYQSCMPTILDEIPLWSGIIARRTSPSIESAMRLWLYHVLRYSRRDQLAVNFALAVSGLAVNRVKIDNHASDFHCWPVVKNRSDEIRFSRPFNYRTLAEALQEDNQLLSTERVRLQGELGLMRASLSWRLTAPLRRLADRWKLAQKNISTQT